MSKSKQKPTLEGRRDFMGKLVAAAGIIGGLVVGKEVIKNFQEGDTSEFREDQGVKQVASELNARLQIINDPKLFETIKFGFGDIRTAAVLGESKNVAVNRDFWNKLTEQEKRVLVIHELCHLQYNEQPNRADNLDVTMVSERSESKEEDSTKRLERSYARTLYSEMTDRKFNIFYERFEAKITQARTGYVATQSR